MLPRDYVKQRDIEIVLSKMTEQVAIRMRREHQKGTIVSIFVTYSKTEMKQPINAQMKIEPTNHTRLLTDTVLTLFRIVKNTHQEPFGVLQSITQDLSMKDMP